MQPELTLLFSTQLTDEDNRKTTVHKSVLSDTAPPSKHLPVTTAVTQHPSIHEDIRNRASQGLGTSRLNTYRFRTCLASLPQLMVRNGCIYAVLSSPVSS